MLSAGSEGTFTDFAGAGDRQLQRSSYSKRQLKTAPKKPTVTLSRYAVEKATISNFNPTEIHRRLVGEECERCADHTLDSAPTFPKHRAGNKNQASDRKVSTL